MNVKPGVAPKTDVYFEYDANREMWRYEAATNRYFGKWYGSSEEIEVPFSNERLYEAEYRDNRIIPKELYWTDRVFDAKYMTGGVPVGWVLEADIEPHDVAAFLGVEIDGTKESGAIVSHPDKHGARLAVLPTTAQEVYVTVHASLPWYATDFAVDPGSVSGSWFRNTEINTADERTKIAHDPDTYRQDLRLVVQLMAWDKVARGACEVNGRPGIEWDQSGVTVTTDEDMLWSVPGSVLLPTLDELGVTYRHVERQRSSLEP